MKTDNMQRLSKLYIIDILDSIVMDEKETNKPRQITATFANADFGPLTIDSGPEKLKIERLIRYQRIFCAWSDIKRIQGTKVMIFQSGCIGVCVLKL